MRKENTPALTVLKIQYLSTYRVPPFSETLSSLMHFRMFRGSHLDSQLSKILVKPLHVVTQWFEEEAL